MIRNNPSGHIKSFASYSSYAVWALSGSSRLILWINFVVTGSVNLNLSVLFALKEFISVFSKESY